MINKQEIIDKLIEEKFEEELECYTIKEGDSYVPGIYNGKVALNGFYLKSTPGSLVNRLENISKAKFKLENDSENYTSEARLQLFLSILKYANMLENGKVDKDMPIDGFLYRNTNYKLMDMAKLAKSNVSTCDRKTGKYFINKLESFEQKFMEETEKVKNQKDEREMTALYGLFTEDLFEERHETTNAFIKWFNSIKEYILTKKQLDYLSGNEVFSNESAMWRLRKNIAERVEKAYVNDRIRINKIEKFTAQLELISSILDFEDEIDMLDRLKEASNEDENIALFVYDYINMKDCSLLSSVLTSNKYDDINLTKDFYYEVISALSAKEIEITKELERLNNKENIL